MSTRRRIPRSAHTPSHRGQADLHIHSLASDGLNSPQQILDYVEEWTNLDVIAITDHDEITGAWEARELHARGHYSFDFVVGEEVTSLSGHLLALDIERPIRMFQSLESTIRAIHEQGGLAIVPHPLVWLSGGLRRPTIERLCHHPDPLIYLDGIEVFNPSFAGKSMHDAVVALNQEVWRLPAFGGSDSHHLETIGTARTTFPGRTWQDLRRAIKERTTEAEGEFWDAHDHYSIAIPQAWRSLVLLPGKRLKMIAGYITSDMAERRSRRHRRQG
jgi:predicted metal-dependent phosphoesterase TrpH